MVANEIGDFKLKCMRFQYWFTITAAIPLGLGIILFPELTRKLFRWKEQDRLIFGISGSVYFAFGLLSLFGLKDPVKWSPVLLLQFVYKVTWLLGVVLVMRLRGELDLNSAFMLVLGYLAMVSGDIAAVPWRHLLGNATPASGR